MKKEMNYIEIKARAKAKAEIVDKIIGMIDSLERDIEFYEERINELDDVEQKYRIDNSKEQIKIILIEIEIFKEILEGYM